MCRHRTDPTVPKLAVPAAIAVATSLVCVLIGWFSFASLAFEPDTAAYLFQAKLFAQGLLAADAPADFGFSPSPHINIHRGLWAAKYPFGNSLFLTPGVLLGAPWAMPAIATGLTLIVFFAIVRDLFGSRVAMLALLLAAISPTTIFLGSSLLSQPTSRLAMALFLWSLLRALRHGRTVEGVLYGAAAGLALGYGFNTRPAVAVVFGVAALVLVLCSRFRTRTLAGLAPAGAAAGLALAVMVALFAAWNAYFTGDPLQLPYHALQAADRMGFGLRGEGYAPIVADFGNDFTPAVAFMRIWQHTLPCVLFNVSGWGDYFPNMLLFSEPARYLPPRAWLLVVPAALIATPLLHRSRGVADLFCAALFVLTLGLLFFQYADHSTWGETPLHCSYYNEVTLFGLIPLTARGLLIVYDTLAPHRQPAISFALAAAAALLLANTLDTHRRIALRFANWDPHYQRLPELVAAADIHNAVIFVPHTRNAPIGDYPFVPLAQADIVYFRTGPLPRWRLDTPDWRTAYENYFSGRAAYVFEDLALRRLETRPVPQDG